MTIQQELLAWATDYSRTLGVSFTRAQPLDGDAGFRQYIRLNTQPAMLAVYGPPATEQHAAFVSIAKHWQSHGIAAPKVYAFDAQRGFLLVEDFGSRSLADALAEAKSLTEVGNLYLSVLSQLQHLQQAPPQDVYPAYTAALLAQEMALFEPWFVEGLLGYTLTAHEKSLLHAFYEPLIHQATEQPQVIVHRDFHCRNIHEREAAPATSHHDAPTVDFGLIDFQDAVVGPVTYDCVSLLKDCYQRWPASFVRAQAEQYRQALPPHLRMPPAQWEQAFDWMGLQRHLKVLGIFARLALRDSKPRYLNDLPVVIAYVRDVCQRYAVLQPFGQWFDATLVPLCERQPWYDSVGIQP